MDDKAMKIHTKSLKRTIIIVISLIVLLGGGLATAAFVVLSRTNQAATESIATTRQKATDNLEELNNRLAEADASNADKIAAIANFKQQLATLVDTLCADAAGTAYYNFLEEYDRCQEAKATLRAANDSLSSVEAHIASDNELAKLIPNKTDELTFQQSYDLWAAAVTQANEVKVSNSMEDEKALVVAALTAYRDAWKAVVEADASQNETAFVAAEKGLGVAHTQLIELSTSLSESLGGLSAEFTTKFEAFLSQTNAS
jgi:hypothetical protein